MDNKETSERTIGIIKLVLGLLLGWMSIAWPLMAAIEGQQTLALSLKGAIITPVILTSGLIYTIFGKRASFILGHPYHPSSLGWVFRIVFLFVGLFVYYLLKYIIRSYGYDI